MSIDAQHTPHSHFLPRGRHPPSPESAPLSLVRLLLIQVSTQGLGLFLSPGSGAVGWKSQGSLLRDLPAWSRSLPLCPRHIKWVIALSLCPEHTIIPCFSSSHGHSCDFLISHPGTLTSPGPSVRYDPPARLYLSTAPLPGGPCRSPGGHF